MSFRVHDDDYEAFYRKTKDLDKKVRTRVRKRIAQSARTIAPKIVTEGADGLPSGGGLAANVVAKSGGPTISQKSTGVVLLLGRKKGPQIGRMDKGQLRHPAFMVWWQKKSGQWVFSDPKLRFTWKWVDQKIPAGTFTKAALDHQDEIRDSVADEMTTILKELKV